MCSRDLEHWEVVCDLMDYRHCDPNKTGLQYVDFEFEGDDILYLCRTAMNNPHNYHDSNYITFHKIKHFRSLSASAAETNSAAQMKLQKVK